MQQRTVTKSITLDGRSWQLRKFSAMDGIKLGKLLISKLLPFVEGLVSSGNIDAAKSITDTLANADASVLDKVEIGKIANILESVSDDDLNYLELMCFKNVSELLPAGPVTVMSDNGFYQIADVEYDPQLFVFLIWEQIKFGLSDLSTEAAGNRSFRRECWIPPCLLQQCRRRAVYPRPAQALEAARAMGRDVYSRRLSRPHGGFTG